MLETLMRGLTGAGVSNYSPDRSTDHLKGKPIPLTDEQIRSAKRPPGYRDGVPFWEQYKPEEERAGRIPPLYHAYHIRKLSECVEAWRDIPVTSSRDGNHRRRALEYLASKGNDGSAPILEGRSDVH